MTLEEAIETMKSTQAEIGITVFEEDAATGEAIKVLLAAVSSGEMIPKADARLAVALAYQRAGGMADDFHKRALEWAKTVRGLEKHIDETDSSRIRDAILALAPADDLADVQALRVNVVEFAQTATERNHRIAEEAARAEAAEAEVARLREALAACAKFDHDIFAKIRIARAAITPKGETK